VSKVPYNKADFKDIVDVVNNQLLQSGFNTDCVINTSDVKSAVKRLKVHKNDGDLSLDRPHN